MSLFEREWVLRLLREVLAKKAISIFIQASLPGMIRVSKIDISL